MKEIRSQLSRGFSESLMSPGPSSSEASPRVEEDELPQWEKDYYPWSLLLRSMVLIGKQSAILLFVYFQLCTWNPAHHKVLHSCRPSLMGSWSYLCEATKACARCFPLVAASTSMITAGRFMLQSRLFYHMLQSRALIDFHNYKISRDIFVIVVIGGCFLMSVVHIAMDIFLPPHAGVQRLTNICTVYLVPCAIFFGLYDSASDVERHFVPLTKFYEENPLHAKVHLGASELYLEEELKSASVKSRQRTRSAAQGDTYSLNQLLDETLKVAQPYEGKIATASTPLAPVAHRSKTSRNLFKGLWPARILLDPRLDDQDSIGFKHAWLAFSVMFVLIQAAVLVSLVSSGLGELWDAQADHYPYGTVEVNGSHYEHVGVGYCRELGMKIPDGYYTALSNLVAPPNIAAEPPAPRRGLAVAKISAPRNAKAPRSNAAAAKRKKAQSSSRSISVQPDVLPYSFLETRSDLNPLKKKRDPEAAALEEWHHDSEQTCAKHCSSNPNCGAYAVDQDKCTIYLKVAGQAPQGWSDFIERAAAHQGPAVVQQTNGAYGVDCWGKLDGQEDPHEYMGALVCFSFAAIVFMVAVVAIWQLRKHVLE